MIPLSDHRQHSFPRGGFDAVVAVNVQFFTATVFGVGAWAIWPARPEWWGLGVLSVMLGLAGAGSLVNAVKAMLESYRRERVLADYLALGGAPKSARLATTQDLKRAGMVE